MYNSIYYLIVIFIMVSYYGLLGSSIPLKQTVVSTTEILTEFWASTTISTRSESQATILYCVDREFSLNKKTTLKYNIYIY